MRLELSNFFINLLKFKETILNNNDTVVFARTEQDLHTEQSNAEGEQDGLKVNEKIRKNNDNFDERRTNFKLNIKQLTH